MIQAFLFRAHMQRIDTRELEGYLLSRGTHKSQHTEAFYMSVCRRAQTTHAMGERKERFKPKGAMF